MQLCNNHRQICKTKKTNLFTQFCIEENLSLPEHMPDVEQLVSCVVDPEVISIKTINTMKGLSYEGQLLTGKKAVIELHIKQKLLYVAKQSKQSIHVLENDFYQSAYVVIPNRIEGTDPEYLIKQKYLKPEIIIEDIYYNLINKRSIFKNICVMLQLVLIPTYELCYSVHKNCSYSNLFLMHEDGTNELQISHDTSFKNIKPKWSPTGHDIAFLSKRDGCFMLYLYDTKSSCVKRITNPSCYKSITGFCWTADGKNLCFTGIRGNTKEIYMINIQKLNTKQLTYGEDLLSSYSPKCSPDGCRIGFIRSFSKLTDLWVMNTDGTNCTKVTTCGGLTSFDWSPDSKHIAYVCSIDGHKDRISILDIESCQCQTIHLCEHIPKIRKVLYSYDQCHLAFIGTNMNTDNLYLYHLESGTLHNLTQYNSDTKISDYVWKIDSSKIYCSVNDLFYYNIYSITPENGTKTQLTFTTASEMELDYRPLII